MITLQIVALLLLLVYACFLTFAVWGLKDPDNSKGTGETDGVMNIGRASEPAKVHAALNQAPSVTVIICARNEAANIGACLRTLISQEYPRDKLRVVVMDDASDDATAQVARHALEGTGVSFEVIANEFHL